MKPSPLRPSLRASALRISVAGVIALLIEALVVLFREKILSSAHGSLLFVLGLLLPVLWLLVEISGPLYYVRTHAYEIYEDRVEERVGLFSGA